MLTFRCDLCNKNIKKEPIMASVGYFPKAELCEKCGAPIVRFLEKHKFVDKKEKTKTK